MSDDLIKEAYRAHGRRMGLASYAKLGHAVFVERARKGGLTGKGLTKIWSKARYPKMARKHGKLGRKRKSAPIDPTTPPKSV